MAVRAVDERGEVLFDRAMRVWYDATPEDWEHVSDQSRFVEFADGMLIMHSPVSEEHADLFDFVYPIVSFFVRRRRLGKVYAGPFTMDLGLSRKFEPDIMFVKNANLVRIGKDRLNGPADLAIEIASPSTRAYDRGHKRRWYAEGALAEYWMLDGYDRRVTIDRPAGTEVLSTERGRVVSEACPGLWFEAEWFWQDPPPDSYECLNRILADPS